MDRPPCLGAIRRLAFVDIDRLFGGMSYVGGKIASRLVPGGQTYVRVRQMLAEAQGMSGDEARRAAEQEIFNAVLFALPAGKMLGVKNFLRIGSGRLSIGPAPKYFNKMPDGWKKKLIPGSAHFEKGHGSITCYWCGKDAKGQFKQFILWGDLNELRRENL